MTANSDDDDLPTDPGAPIPDAQTGKYAKFDPDESARLLELTPQQKILADGVLRGLTQTAAAKEAGYLGVGADLRASASRAAKSQKVKNYIAWAQGEVGRKVDDPADLLEIRRTLSKILRGVDKNAAIRAAEALTRLHNAEREREAEVRPPVETLNEMAKHGYFATLLAVTFAKRFNIDWEPPEPLPDGFEAKAIDTLERSVGPAAAARAKYVSELSQTRQTSQNFVNPHS